MKNKLFAVLLTLVILSAPVSVLAAGDDSGDIMVTNTVSPLQEDAEKMRALADEVRGEIDSYRDKEATDLDESAVRETRHKYVSLPDAYRVLVGSTDALEAAEALLEISYDDGELVSPASADPDTKTGTDYTFVIDDSSEDTSVSASFIDSDSDGAVDVPTFTLTSPDGSGISCSTDMSHLESASGTLDLTWTDDFVQFDIKNGLPGSWSLTATSPAMFTLVSSAVVSEFQPEEEQAPEPAGEEPEAPEEEESEEASPAPAEEEASEFVTTENPEAVSNDSSSVLELIKLFAPLVILIAAPVIGIIFIRSLNKDDSGKKKTKKEKKAKKEPRKAKAAAGEEEPIRSESEEKQDLLSYYNELIEGEDYSDDTGSTSVQESAAPEPEQPSAPVIEEYEEYPSELLTPPKPLPDYDDDIDDSMF